MNMNNTKMKTNKECKTIYSLGLRLINGCQNKRNVTET